MTAATTPMPAWTDRRAWRALVDAASAPHRPSWRCAPQHARGKLRGELLLVARVGVEAPP